MLIHQLFEEQARLVPDNTAIQMREKELTYSQLNEWVNAVAAELISKGVKEESVVAIYLERSIEMVVAMLAVLKAGGAYVAIDPKYPQSRREFIVKETETIWVITEEKFERLFENINIISCNKVERFLCDNPELIISESALAYIIYTSGSTGIPKGVMVEHRNTVNFINWAIEEYKIGNQDVSIAFSPVTFDLSIFEIFVTLCAGAKLIIGKIPFDITSPEYRDQITIFSTVPSSFKSLTAFKVLLDEKIRFPRLRIFNFAGEALNAAITREVYEVVGPKHIYNCYGPTETTTYATVAYLKKGSEDEPTIGRAVGNTTIYIVNPETMEAVQDGKWGEIIIGGKGVTRGYLKREELTAEKFIKFNSDKVYRTGDKGRINALGLLECKGRYDEQVKIKGHRVEVLELEKAILTFDKVNNAAVVAVETAAGEKILSAFVESKEGFEKQLLIKFLNAKLPYYMLPSNVLVVNPFPLTSSGKVDKKNLIERLSLKKQEQA